ncbi:MAG: nuclear transport factor 2 family protein [Gemmatimonadota bacterium]
MAQLLARDQIRQLAERYALAIDCRDLDGLARLFVPDVECGRWGTGSDALRASFEDQLRVTGPTVSLIANHVIDFDDDTTAHGIAYGVVEAARPEGWIRQMIQYHDDYVLRDQRWRFLRRQHLLWYGIVLPYDPLAQPPADWPRSQVGRGTVPECWESWRRFQHDATTPRERTKT